MSEYLEGFIDGMTAFAWWKDGVQQVGTLRREAEALFRQVVFETTSDKIELKDYDQRDIDLIEAAFKAQRKQEVQAMLDHIAIGGHRIEYMHSSTWEIEYREVNDWLSQRKKELE